MKAKNKDQKASPVQGEMLITWSARYDTGIGIIDSQHREFVNLINKLYSACLHGRDGIQAGFKEAMSGVVQYVHFHFDAEMEILEKAGYPHASEHKKEHERLIKEILGVLHGYENGVPFVPNKFARVLKDWVLTHIAFQDKDVGEYLAIQKKLESPKEPPA